MLDAIHSDQLRQHGGRPGLKDENVLESAIARARQRWAYEPGSDLATLAAACGYGLAEGLRGAFVAVWRQERGGCTLSW